MKKLFFLLFTLGYCNVSSAQSDSVSFESKLLEFYHNQRYSDAVRHLLDRYKTTPPDTHALLSLAYANLMSGKMAAAKKYYQEVLQADSSNFMAYKQLALMGKSRAGVPHLDLLKKAYELNPADADVAIELSTLYIKRNAFDEAGRILEPALQADSSNVRLLEIKMPIGVAEKRYPEVIALGNQLLGAGDSSTMVLSNLGKSHFMLLDYKNALKNFLYIRDTLDKETLYQQIAATYRGLKDYKNAILALQSAIKAGVSPKTATYYGQLGDSYEMSGKYEDAGIAYKKGLQFENNGTLYYNIALLYETKLNDKKKASGYYEQYLKTLNEKTQSRQVIFIRRKIDELKK